MKRFTFTGNAFADGRSPDPAPGAPKAEVRIAVNRGYRDRQTGEWVSRPPLSVRIGSWVDGRSTDAILQTRGGDGVVVDGDIDDLGTWLHTDDDGQKTPRAEIQVRNPRTYERVIKTTTGEGQAAPARTQAQRGDSYQQSKEQDVDDIV